MDISGIGSEGAVINLVLFLGLIAKLFVWPWMQAKRGKTPNRRKSDNPGNPSNPNNSKPGNAPECKKHMEALAAIKEAITTIKGQILDIYNELRKKADK